MLDGVTGDEFHNLDSSLARGPRYVGDPWTWTIPILPKVDAPCPLLTEMNSWSLRYDRGLKPLFDFSLLISPQLRYCYLVLDEFLEEQIQKNPVLPKKSSDEGEEYVLPCLCSTSVLDLLTQCPKDKSSNPLPYILMKYSHESFEEGSHPVFVRLIIYFRTYFSPVALHSHSYQCVLFCERVPLLFRTSTKNKLEWVGWDTIKTKLIKSSSTNKNFYHIVHHIYHLAISTSASPNTLVFLTLNPS